MRRLSACARQRLSWRSETASGRRRLPPRRRWRRSGGPTTSATWCAPVQAVPACSARCTCTSASRTVATAQRLPRPSRSACRAHLILALLCAVSSVDLPPCLAPQDLERKHASDRELWRRDTAEAVHAAREEMATLADQRLDATTKQTICDNEAMAGRQCGVAGSRQQGTGRVL